MLFSKITSKHYSTPSIYLPLTYMLLTEWTLIRLQGKDAIQYLHNQFTCNIKNLNKHQYTFSGHCNPQGKMISNMYVFHFNEKEIAFIQKKNVCSKQITVMQKYAVFSKINIIQDNNIQLIGIAGKNARKYLNIFFSTLPNSTNMVIHEKNIILLYFKKPTERFLLIIKNKSISNNLFNQSQFEIQIKKNCQWIALDIEAEYPWIESNTSEIFIPQAVNMDILQGISFNKGCYLGQEPIARIQYRGNNKKMLFRLINTIPDIKNINRSLKPGEYLKLKIKNQNEKYIGIVLQISQITENHTWIQVILNKSILKYSKQQSIIETIQTSNDNFITL